MKNIKLKNPNLCAFVIYLPVIIITLLGIVAVFVFREEIGVPCLLAAIVLDLVYLVKNFVELMSIGIVVDQVSNWQKTRLWFDVGNESESAKEIECRITERCQKHGKEKQVNVNCPQLVSVRYKRHRSLTIDVAASEKVVLLYRTDYLDSNIYSNIMSSAKSAVKQMKCKVSELKFLEKEQKKSPVLTSTAVVIIADYMDLNLSQKIRKTPNFTDTAIIPCVIDLSSKRCYFDGMREISIAGSSPVKNRTIKLIVKTVFNGRLPLKNNENFDYDILDRHTPETTLAELHKAYKEANAENAAETKRFGKRLRDGETEMKDDFLYLKHGDRLAVFGVFEDEENPDIVEIGIDDYWSYPNKSKISKNDIALLKKRAKEHFKDKKVIFTDEEIE